ncbi:MAG: NAD(P)H-dependent oxidoreductase subunit E [bacterium]|nr:NAD(P)H-dependent oxidoreductase subunit E [bacterium]
MNVEVVHNILHKHQNAQDGLISILEDIQSQFGYLPAEALKIVAGESGKALVDIYGVATFYKSFSLKPRGKHLISVCLGTACHVRNAPVIGQEFERQLGVKAGETTEDWEFTLERVNCLGACALGPIVVVDGHYFSKVNTAKVKQIIDRARRGLDKVEVKTDNRVFPIGVRCPRCNHSLMDSKHLIDGLPSIRVTASYDRMHGRLSLSSLYGSYNVSTEYVVPDNAIVNLFCPHCHAMFSGSSDCTICEAPLIPMIVDGGGMLQVCSRNGCKNHMLDLSGINI